MVSSEVIFTTLYLLITLGVAPDPLTMVSPLDSPENLIRLRLACVMLETCGCFFDKGSPKKKLDIYLQETILILSNYCKSPDGQVLTLNDLKI